MQTFQDYLAHGNAWLFIPFAILLGALHGLEPGHSKTMMAAFIISIRGTVAQAVLLGACAALSHTVLIWLLAAAGLYFSGKIDIEGLEPWFHTVSGLIIVAMALWMFRRVRREQLEAEAHAHHRHEDDHAHGPHGGVLLDTGHGRVEISVFETGVPPVFRIYFFDTREQSETPPASLHVTLETIRPNGARETFSFSPCGAYLEYTSL